MINTIKNKFTSKINEMHHVITIDKNPITKIMCETLLLQLSSSECADFFSDDTKSLEINQIKYNLLECSNVNMPNKIDHNKLVVMINNICSKTTYNKNVIHEINTNFESLLNLITIDHKLITQVKSQDDNFYIKLLNFLIHSDVIKVFKNIHSSRKTIPVCRCALQCDYNCIKYMDHILDENMCDIAMALGHTNLSDISQKFHTESICKKYIDINNGNLKHITHTSNISNAFFMSIIDNNINNINNINKIMTITDPLFFNTTLCSDIVKRNGLLIRYLPFERQTMRLLELAMTQNKLAKYYVTYGCFPNVDITEIQTGVIDAFAMIKKIKESINYHKFIDACLIMCKSELSLKTGILMKKQCGNDRFFVMTGENYLNHQYQSYFDNEYTPNIDVIESKVFYNVKTSTKSQNVINELAASFVDSHKNSYVVFFEFA